MDLYLLRHGIPIDPQHWHQNDDTRPLTDPGRAQVREVIRTLKDGKQLDVDAIWASPYSRTAETARIAGEILGIHPLYLQALASGSDLLHSLPTTQGNPNAWPGKLLLVGHQPDLGILLQELVGDEAVYASFGRSGIGHLRGEFRAGGMQLQWLRTADEIISRFKGVPLE